MRTSINQSNTSFYSYSSIYFFDDFVILFPFHYEFLGIRRLKLGVFSSSVGIPLGRDIWAHRCCQDQSVQVTTLADSKVKSAGTP